MTYNQLYTRPKNPEYGLYYSPMLMIDGIDSVNGRDPAAAEAAIREALAWKPAVGLKVALDATIPVRDRLAWKREKLRLAIFVQDKRTGIVHQAADVP